MKFEEFIQQAVRTESRTCNPINSRIRHAAYGLVTESNELMAGVLESVKNGRPDFTNFKEELGDIFWYVAIYTDETGMHPYNESFARYAVNPFSEPLLWNAMTQIDAIQMSAEISIIASKFLDHIKKAEFYGREINLPETTELLRALMVFASSFCLFLETTIEDEMQRVINKLKVRYPEKFTEEKAYDRDLEKERLALEQLSK